VSDSEFYTPTDADVLRMENELLTLEVRFLRARLGWTKVTRGPRGSSTSLSRISHLEDAERDLVLLLRRMISSPLGSVFRRSSNFQTLEERYLRSPVGGPPSSARRIAYLEGAEQDLILLLRRISVGPLGRVLRSRRSFRTLETRYL
jgi:hypothetical protein